MADDTGQDDGIIELTQVVEDMESDTLDQEEIELVDITSPMEEPQKDVPEPVFDAGAEAEGDAILLEDNDFDFDLDMEETAKADFKKPDEISEPALAMESGLEESIAGVEPSIKKEQLDEAIERVIEKKFSEKIEKILFEVVEKFLEKEIDDIRKRLQKDLDEIANS